MDPVGTITWIVLFVIATVAVTGIVGRLGWSAPVALVVVGGAVSFIPGVPQVEVQPELILYGILPPLLFAAAHPDLDHRCARPPRQHPAAVGRAGRLHRLRGGLRGLRADPVDHARGRVRLGRRDRAHRCDRCHGDRRSTRPAAARRHDPRGREPAQRCDRARGPQRVHPRDRQRRLPRRDRAGLRDRRRGRHRRRASSRASSSRGSARSCTRRCSTPA